MSKKWIKSSNNYIPNNMCEDDDCMERGMGEIKDNGVCNNCGRVYNEDKTNNEISEKQFSDKLEKELWFNNCRSKDHYEDLESNKEYLFPNINVVTRFIESKDELSIMIKSNIVVEHNREKYLVFSLYRYNLNLLELNRVINLFINQCKMIEKSYLVDPERDVKFDSIYKSHKSLYSTINHNWWEVFSYSSLEKAIKNDQGTPIERRYKILIRRCHPDNVKTGDRNKFEQVQKAWKEYQKFKTKI